jgi:hypothetical protein
MAKYESRGEDRNEQRQPLPITVIYLVVETLAALDNKEFVRNALLLPAAAKPGSHTYETRFGMVDASELITNIIEASMDSATSEGITDADFRKQGPEDRPLDYFARVREHHAKIAFLLPPPPF